MVVIATAAQASTISDDWRLTHRWVWSRTLSAYVNRSFAFIGTTGAASDVSTWATTTSYTKLSVAFTAGSASTMKIWVHGWYGQGTIYVDDVAVS